MKAFEVSGIINGQYIVTINLLKLGMSSTAILNFENGFYEISRENNTFEMISSLDNNILTYYSESLFPKSIKTGCKKKVMIIFGNPAIHSIVKGMFFYSHQNGDRHHLWGRLENSGLLSKQIRKNIDDRGIEANKIKEAILNGSTSHEEMQNYVVGLTTFYSFPTPIKSSQKKDSAQWKYGDADGVKTLFESVLPRIHQEEIDRLESYDFCRDAIWICTQNSSYKYIREVHHSSPVKYWPIRGLGSGGNNLKNILLSA